MAIKKMTDSCWYFPGRVNIGYLYNGSEGMIIDSGIDDGAMKKVYKQLVEKDMPITYLFITHAHADHYGGASYLQKQTDVTVIAPYLEEAVLRNPILEPIYLFGGNEPLPELRNKFLEGKPVEIHHIIKEGNHTFGGFSITAHLLKGHSYYQLGVEYEHIIYAGDGYFSEEQLFHHKIPYLTNAREAIESLEKLKLLPCKGALPAHGKFEKEFQTTLKKNIVYHRRLLDWLEEYICRHKSGISHEQVVAGMCTEFNVEAQHLSQWLLYRTAVTSYLTALLQAGKVSYQIEQGMWILYSSEETSTTEVEKDDNKRKSS